MMDRREALLLVDRLKRRTRDPEVLTLCEYVHGTDVHGTVPGFRRPDVPWTPPAVFIHLMPGVRWLGGGRGKKKVAPWAPDGGGYQVPQAIERVAHCAKRGK